MRVLAESEVQFDELTERDELGPGLDDARPDAPDGWWTITVRATWRSPTGRSHVGESKLDRVPLGGELTAAAFVREADLREAALCNLNEALRELAEEAAAVCEYLERDVFEVRAGGSSEGFFPDEPGAARYADQLRREVGAQRVEVVPTSPKGKIRDLRDPKPEAPR
jgi:hypothetical protein